MNRRARVVMLPLLGFMLLCCLDNLARGETSVDRRAVEVGYNTQPNLFRHPRDLPEWQARKHELRQQMRAAMGIWPEPESSDLSPRVFGRIELSDITIDKLLLETRPGLWVACSIYRPRSVAGKLPAVLCPHGHWPDGHVQMDVAVARSYNLARQGYLVVTYDMLGFGDTRQIRHDSVSPAQELWGLTVSQLQTWDSIRVLDYVASLPEVDTARIACTGASGGGSQTFLLCAIDDRVTVSSPVNMISSHFQGGCICENPPYLRLDTYNVEIAAMMAPRPMLMVSCSGDWTLNTPWVEYPLIKSIYTLFNQPDHVEMYRQIANHNYNAKSREAVYQFFDHWLMGHDPGRQLADKPVEGFTQSDLRVKPEEFPQPLADEATLLGRWRDAAAETLATALPTDAKSLEAYRERFGAAYPYVLAVKKPAFGDLETWGHAALPRGERFYLGRTAEGDRIPVRWYPSGKPGAPVIVWVEAKGGAGFEDGLVKPDTLASRVLAAGFSVVVPDVFNTGEAGCTRQGQGFFTTYNRTDSTHRVQDILSTVAWAQGTQQAPVHLVGRGDAGLWVLLAQGLAGVEGVTIADAARFDTASDQAFEDRLFVPGLRRVGDFQTAAALAAPGRLVLYNAGKSLADSYVAAYQAAGHADCLTCSEKAAMGQAVVQALTQTNR